MGVRIAVETQKKNSDIYLLKTTVTRTSNQSNSMLSRNHNNFIRNFNRNAEYSNYLSNFYKFLDKFNCESDDIEQMKSQSRSRSYQDLESTRHDDIRQRDSQG